MSVAHRKWYGLLWCLGCGTLLLCGAAAAKPKQPVSSICVEAETGLVLHQEHANLRRPPASMVKLVQLLMVDEGLEAGRWRLDQPIVVTKHAEKMGGTQVFLEAGEKWPLGHLMKAVAIASANDAAMAVAEGLWGSEEAYLKAMNKRVRELGMVDSKFFSVHGLPPDPGESFDQTTARDMALLARACVKRPRVRDWVSQRQFKFRPQDAVKYSTNKLLWRMPDCDGLKTGYIRAAGFCIAATARRNDIRLISVVMGSPSKYGRFNLAEKLMDDAFASVRRVKVVERGEAVSEPVIVLKGKPPEVRLVAGADIELLLTSEQLKRLKRVPVHPDGLTPPVGANTPVGRVDVLLDGKRLGSAPLVPPVELRPKGWYLHLEDGVAGWKGLSAGSEEAEEPPSHPAGEMES